MRILLIDDDALLLRFLQESLEEALAGVEVTVHDSVAQGRPGPDFEWDRYDLLLLDYSLGNGENGIDWLSGFREAPDFPTTVLICAVEDPNLMARAIDGGAACVLGKSGLTLERLVQTVRDVAGAAGDRGNADETTLRLSHPVATTGDDATVPEASFHDTDEVTLPEASLREDDDVTQREGSPSEDDDATLREGTGEAAHCGVDEPLPGDVRSDGPSDPAPPLTTEDSEVESSYRFGRCIGRGAMSRVYLAERSTDRLTVVIKILERRLAKDPELLQRFRMEGALVADIESPFVVKIFERGITNSYDYLVMEFFGRGDLAQQIEHGIAPRQAVAFLYHIACGLKAIHTVNIVHRDLKPANIMFRADGSIALADFGIAKRLDSELDLTEPGGILGTLHYISPEQARGTPVDPRSDLYSAGVIFYEMLTGTRPYSATSAQDMLAQHLHGPVPRLDGRLERYQPIVDGLMCKDIEDRFDSAETLLKNLHAYTHRPARRSHTVRA